MTSRYGPPQTTLLEALRQLSDDSLTISAQSRFFSTPAFPAGSGPDFVNAAVRAETTLSAQELLAQLHAVEADMGRHRANRWAPRVIDLDLIAFGAQVLPDVDTHKTWRDLPLAEQMARAPDRLILPHPRLQDRAFVLGPLCDIAPDWMHPVLGLSVADMLARCPQRDRDALIPLPSPG